MVNLSKNTFKVLALLTTTWFFSSTSIVVASSPEFFDPAEEELSQWESQLLEFARNLAANQEHYATYQEHYATYLKNKKSPTMLATAFTEMQMFEDNTVTMTKDLFSWQGLCTAGDNGFNMAIAREFQLVLSLASFVPRLIKNINDYVRALEKDLYRGHEFLPYYMRGLMLLGDIRNFNEALAKKFTETGIGTRNFINTIKRGDYLMTGCDELIVYVARQLEFHPATLQQLLEAIDTGCRINPKMVVDRKSPLAPEPVIQRSLAWLAKQPAPAPLGNEIAASPTSDHSSASMSEESSADDRPRTKFILTTISEDEVEEDITADEEPGPLQSFTSTPPSATRVVVPLKHGRHK